MGSFLHLASEGVGHPRPLVVLRLVVPDLLLVAAVDLGNDELHVFRDEFALLKWETTDCQTQSLPGKMRTVDCGLTCQVTGSHASVPAHT